MSRLKMCIAVLGLLAGAGTAAQAQGIVGGGVANGFGFGLPGYLPYGYAPYGYYSYYPTYPYEGPVGLYLPPVVNNQLGAVAGAVEQVTRRPSRATGGLRSVRPGRGRRGR